jgi:hypothetical protein
MKLLALHLSDLHAREGEEALCAGIATNIVTSIGQLARSHDTILVVFSGDIAWSGKPQEYAACHQFFSVLAQMRSGAGTPPIVVTTPGNHDLNFETETRDHVDAREKAQRLGHSTLDTQQTLQSLQKPYRDFHTQFVTPPKSKNTVHGVTSLRYSPELVVVDIDSASHAAKECRPGQILLPSDLDACLVALLSDAPADIRIAITHFPPSYYSEASRRTLAEALPGRVDAILTGHEHAPSAFYLTPMSARAADCVPCIHLESGALRGSGHDAKSMRVISIDTATRRLAQMDVSPLGESAELPTPTWNMLPDRCGLAWSVSRLAADYRAAIMRLGVALHHKRRADITLDDVFVYPNLRRVQTLVDKRADEDLHDHPLAALRQHKHIVVQGAEKSGKTSLARRTLLDALANGLCTVILDGPLLSSRSEDGWRQAIADQARATFGPNGAADLVRTPPANRCIIIDNWPPPIKSRHAKLLADYIHREFGLVMLLTRKDLMFECMMSTDPDTRQLADSLASYATYDILRFGRAKRAELIAKWHAMGTEGGALSYVDAKKQQAAETLVGDLLGRFVPSWPLYVLLVLQTMESAQPMSAGAASHGSLYESLIKSALLDAFGQAAEVDAVFHFLAFASGQMPPNGQPTSLAELAHHHATYTSEQYIERNFESDLRGLQGARIVAVANNQVTFVYEYIELFFRAMHLAAHLRDSSNTSIRKQIDTLAGQIWNQRTANLVLFLAYLDQTGQVMEALLAKASTIFTDFAEFDMGVGVPALDNLVRISPTLTLDRQDPEANRRRMLQDVDATEDAVANELEEPSGLKDDAEYKQIQDLSRSYRTIQIIGQIIRVFPGSVAGKHRLRLAQASASLALRTLGFMMESAARSKQFVLERLRNVVRQQHPEALPAAVSVQAEAMLYGICESLAFSVVKHAGAAVSLPSLRPLHAAMRKFPSPNTSLDVILLSIELDAYDDFPRAAIIKAFQEADKSGHMLTADVVRHLAWQHMHTFAVDYKDRQAICEPLRIRNDVRLINPDEKTS